WCAGAHRPAAHQAAVASSLNEPADLNHRWGKTNAAGRARTPARGHVLMPVLVKICGLTTPVALDAALDAGADMVGFVFFPPSPPNLAFEAASALSACGNGRARKVALTVDADDAALGQIIEALQPDLLQLHGRETPERVVAVRKRFGLPVMKALPI